MDSHVDVGAAAARLRAEVGPEKDLVIGDRVPVGCHDILSVLTALADSRRNTLNEVRQALGKCWRWEPTEDGGMETNHEYGTYLDRDAVFAAIQSLED